MASKLSLESGFAAESFCQYGRLIEVDSIVDPKRSYFYRQKSTKREKRTWSFGTKALNLAMCGVSDSERKKKFSSIRENRFSIQIYFKVWQHDRMGHNFCLPRFSQMFGTSQPQSLFQKLQYEKAHGPSGYYLIK